MRAITVRLTGYKRFGSLLAYEDGSYQYCVTRSDGTSEVFSPDELAALHMQILDNRRWFDRLLGTYDLTETPWRLLWTAGQALLVIAWLVQWIASEVRRRPVVPLPFLLLALVATVLIFSWTIWMRVGMHYWDVLYMIGQPLLLIILARNLMLVRKAKRALDASVSAVTST